MSKIEMFLNDNIKSGHKSGQALKTYKNKKNGLTVMVKPFSNGGDDQD